ncbi:hypothetical protein [Campylobacter armoricus]|uniref:hypothetical protein n=1 Tax=Campylobacter armoricus TaxID=2505970 RepID=UPI00111798FB|nr:hypothetical protein [Campylobacter armoricus]
MKKLIYICKKIFDFLENILIRLSSREYKLALILSFIFGFFVVYFSMFRLFENKDMLLNDKLNSLQLKIQQNKNDIIFAQQDINASLKINDNKFKQLKQDYQTILNLIEKKLLLIKAKSVQIQTQHYKDKYFTYYELNLNFISDFNSLLSFLQELDLSIKVKKIELEKYENKLKITLNLIFPLV